MAGARKPEPRWFVAGDTVEWTKTASSYPATDWTLTYYFNNLTAGQLTWTATADGENHVISETAEDTADISPGRWQVSAVYVNGVRRASEGIGQIVVLPNPTDNTQDHRTQSQRMLEAVEAVLEGRASKDQESYSLEGRSLTRMGTEELYRWADRIRAEVRLERDAFNRVNGGGGSSRRVSVVFR